MKLKALSIDIPWNANDKDAFPYRCEVEFQGHNGEIKLVLQPELTKAILDVVADELVKATREVAELITREVIEGNAEVPLLENGDNVVDDDVPF